VTFHASKRDVHFHSNTRSIHFKDLLLSSTVKPERFFLLCERLFVIFSSFDLFVKHLSVAELRILLLLDFIQLFQTKLFIDSLQVLFDVHIFFLFLSFDFLFFFDLFIQKLKVLNSCFSSPLLLLQFPRSDEMSFKLYAILRQYRHHGLNKDFGWQIHSQATFVPVQLPFLGEPCQLVLGKLHPSFWKLYNVTSICCVTAFVFPPLL